MSSNNEDKDQETSDTLRKRSEKVISPATDPNELAELARRAKELASSINPLREEEANEKILELGGEDTIPELAEQLHTAGHFEDASLGVNHKIKLRKRNYTALTENSAANMIRSKLAHMYAKEPNAQKEELRAEASRHRSKHQQFMIDLTNSGKSLAEVQTQWHNYYTALPDEEKHQVWQEFYQTQEHAAHHPVAQKKQRLTKTPHQLHQSHPTTTAYSPTRTTAEIKSQLLEKVSANGKLTPKQHLKSLAFGLGLAGFVSLAMMFTFFNEVIIAPFISPSRNVSATPIIGDVNSPVSPDPKIIIPKINLEVPVVYDVGSTDEKAVQEGLERGVVHYINSPAPGQQGNVVIVGHSSNNILNKGKYKFAFVLLKRLEVDDTIIIHYNSTRYVYKVYSKTIVDPSDVSVLGNAEKPNTITLITCDPPGTTLKRLIIKAEQVTPDPNSNAAAAPTQSQPTPEALPSNAPSLWSRIFD